MSLGRTGIRLFQVHRCRDRFKNVWIGPGQTPVGQWNRNCRDRWFHPIPWCTLQRSTHYLTQGLGVRVRAGENW